MLRTLSRRIIDTSQGSEQWGQMFSKISHVPPSRMFEHYGIQTPLLRRNFHSPSTKFPQQAASKPSEISQELPTSRGFISWYLQKLNEKPVITKSVTASAIFVVADGITQIMTTEKRLPIEVIQHIDYPRLGRMAAIGLFLWGPTLHLWFGLMARILPRSDILSILKKMALGQCFYGPSFTATFFAINGAAQGESGHEIWLRLKRDMLPTFTRGLAFWPFCDFVTYRFIPVHLMPLGNNVAALIWTIYITYVAGQKKVVDA